jgi:very-short-patch-repair endonuclease
MTLERLGLRVLRFWNDEVLVHTEVVLDAILSAHEVGVTGRWGSTTGTS